MGVAPSGEQFEIRFGDTVAVVTEVGGGLRELRVGSARLLDGYAEAEICDGARGQTLLPWPNRIRDGRYTWRGAEQQLAMSEPPTNCVIHGLTRWANWRLAERTPDAVRMTYRLPPQTGWGWVLDLAIGYRVDATGVTVTTTAANRSDTPAPFAAGAHPYLAVGTERVDVATLHVPAAAYLPTDQRQIPTGRAQVGGTPYDFRTPRRLGDTRIDHAYAELDRDGDGLFAATLAGDWTTQVWMDAGYRYLEVFTGDTLPDPGRRRRGLGLEPMTAPPDAFNVGTDLITLDPGGTWRGRWGIRLA